MKKLIVLCSFIMFAQMLKSQALSDFYENSWGIYIYHTSINSSADGYINHPQSGEYTYSSKTNLWSLNLGEIAMYKEEPMKFNMFVQSDLLGDLWYWLVQVAKTKDGDVKTKSPNFASIYEIRLGLNVYGSSELVVAAGLSHYAYVISSYDYSPLYGQIYGDSKDYIKNGTHFTVGPFARVDKNLGSIMLRFSTALNYSVYAGNASEPKKDLPMILELGPQIQLLNGLYFGVDYQKLLHLKSEKPDGEKYFGGSRLDLKLGWMINLWDKGFGTRDKRER
ncbi:MAG: hypothetical protein HGB12_05700 [Bacteroidetes bacterium]|nr:hypothetical protein [Bacteroidota bacterium]